MIEFHNFFVATVGSLRTRISTCCTQSLVDSVHIMYKMRIRINMPGFNTYAEQVGSAVTCLIYIWKVLGSSNDEGTVYLQWDLLWLLQTVSAKCQCIYSLILFEAIYIYITYTVHTASLTNPQIYETLPFHECIF